MSAEMCRRAADRLEELAARTPGGRWSTRGLLATRPEVVAELPDGTSQHVAEARAATAGWITTLSPALAGPLAGWLRRAGDDDAEAAAVAAVLLGAARGQCPTDPGR